MSETATLHGRIRHINMQFLTRMAQIRAQLRRTQEELGAAVGLTRFTISDIEAGHRPLRLAEAVLICEALGVSLADMLGDAEPVLVTETRIEFTTHATTPR